MVKRFWIESKFVEKLDLIPFHTKIWGPLPISKMKKILKKYYENFSFKKSITFLEITFFIKKFLIM